MGVNLVVQTQYAQAPLQPQYAQAPLQPQYAQAPLQPQYAQAPAQYAQPVAQPAMVVKGGF